MDIFKSKLDAKSILNEESFTDSLVLNTFLLLLVALHVFCLKGEKQVELYFFLYYGRIIIHTKCNRLFHLIVLDVLLPSFSGVDTLPKIRKNSRFKFE